MSQYVPLRPCAGVPGDQPKAPPQKRRAPEAYMAALELDGFTQDPHSATEGYMPNFDLTGV